MCMTLGEGVTMKVSLFRGHMLFLLLSDILHILARKPCFIVGRQCEWKSPPTLKIP